MTSTVAYSTLLELIEVFGTFCTTRWIFNLSIIDLLVILFVVRIIIGIFFGGIAPLDRSRTSQVREVSVSRSDASKGVIESYKGGGSY